MRGAIGAAAVLWLGLGLIGCSPKSAPTEQAESPQQTPPAAASLDPGGTKFDPPIEASEVPRGSSYCDMGTVHYAHPGHSNEPCPVCGMALKYKE